MADSQDMKKVIQNMVQKLVSEYAPVETIVLTPQEVEKRLAIGDQFIEEIMEKGEVLYAA